MFGVNVPNCETYLISQAIYTGPNVALVDYLRGEEKS
jgi:hypothetical protein